MIVTCQFCGVSCDTEQTDIFAHKCGLASSGTTKIVTKEEINSRADEDRALRDRLAMDLFRDDRSKDGYFEAETSARVALDDADIFMAERAKRDKDHG